MDARVHETATDEKEEEGLFAVSVGKARNQAGDSRFSTI